MSVLGRRDYTGDSARLDQFLPILLLLAAVLVLLSYLFFPSELVPASVAVFDLSWWRIMLLSTALMFPVALVSGILFPSIAASVQASCGRPDEQHRDHHPVQYDGRSVRSASCKFRPSARHRVSTESHRVRCRLCVDEHCGRLCSASTGRLFENVGIAARSKARCCLHGSAWSLDCSDFAPGNFSVSTR